MQKMSKTRYIMSVEGDHDITESDLNRAGIYIEPCPCGGIHPDCKGWMLVGRIKPKILPLFQVGIDLMKMV